MSAADRPRMRALTLVQLLRAVGLLLGAGLVRLALAADGVPSARAELVEPVVVPGPAVGRLRIAAGLAPGHRRPVQVVVGHRVLGRLGPDLLDLRDRLTQHLAGQGVLGGLLPVATEQLERDLLLAV